MEVLFLLLPLSILFVLAIAAAFWWAIFSGQFDDSEKAARSILQDDDSAGADQGRHADAATPPEGQPPDKGGRG